MYVYLYVGDEGGAEQGHAHIDGHPDGNWLDVATAVRALVKIWLYS